MSDVTILVYSYRNKSNKTRWAVKEQWNEEILSNGRKMTGFDFHGARHEAQVWKRELSAYGMDAVISYNYETPKSTAAPINWEERLMSQDHDEQDRFGALL